MWSLFTLFTLFSLARSTNNSIYENPQEFPFLHENVFTTAKALFTEKIHTLSGSLPALELPIPTWQDLSTTVIIGLLISLVLACRIIYLLFFHPLAGYPGPKLAAVSYLPLIHLNISGRGHLRLKYLHQKYGPFVRVGPNTISIGSVKGQEIIHGSRPVFPKGSHYDCWVFGSGNPSLVPCRNITDHAAQRVAIAPMFHRPNMLKQERHVMQHVKLLMEKIRKHGMRRRGEDGRDQDGMEMGFWSMAFATDVITDLAFGGAFGSLKAEKIHWVVNRMNSYFFMIIILDCIRHFPLLFKILPRFLPKSVTEQRTKLAQFGWTRIRERLQNTAPRDDFITALRDVPEDQRLTDEYLIRNNIGFIVAGGETTATSLTAILHFLSKNPRAYEHLANEIRSTFTLTDEISATNLEHLPYINAVISESLRLFPPLVTLGIRESPGAMVDGKYVPAGTECFSPQYVHCHNPQNFHSPGKFIPERWLEMDSKENSDARKASIPFSIGPRACIGRNLALIELRLVIARIFWEFEFEAVEKERDLLKDSSVMLVWIKAPVWLRFMPREKVTDQ